MITLCLNHCLRCQHEWYQRPRAGVMLSPKVCPKCKSISWKTPRIPHVGRPFAYPEIELLEAGQTIVLPWLETPQLNKNRQISVTAYAKRTGKKIHVIGNPGNGAEAGCHVHRSV